MLEFSTCGCLAKSMICRAKQRSTVVGLLALAVLARLRIGNESREDNRLELQEDRSESI